MLPGGGISCCSAAQEWTGLLWELAPADQQVKVNNLLGCSGACFILKNVGMVLKSGQDIEHHNLCISAD